MSRLKDLIFHIHVFNIWTPIRVKYLGVAPVSFYDMSIPTRVHIMIIIELKNNHKSELSMKFQVNKTIILYLSANENANGL